MSMTKHARLRNSDFLSEVYMVLPKVKNSGVLWKSTFKLVLTKLKNSGFLWKSTWLLLNSGTMVSGGSQLGSHGSC